MQGNLGELGALARSWGARGDAARGKKGRGSCVHSQVDGLYIDGKAQVLSIFIKGMALYYHLENLVW